MAGRSILDHANQQYRVTFYEREETYNRLVAWLGDTPPTPQNGGGGYQIVTLPKRSAVSVWQGRDQLLIMDIPIMLWQDTPEPTRPTWFGRTYPGVPLVNTPISTKAQANRLIKMWRPADDTEEPPVVKVKAPNNLVPYSTLPFVLNDFTWGAAIGDEDGQRVMQQLVIQVMEYRADEELQTTKAKAPTTWKRNKIYVFKSGDTLTKIAARYHLKNGWKQLAAAQHPPIKDPRAVKVGTKLIIPGQGASGTANPFIPR